MASSGEDSDDSLDPPTKNNIPSFSFSGCGFLGVYHVGVAACLRDHTDVVNRREIRFAGASAGALVATTLLCDIDFGEMTKLLLEVAKAVRNKDPVDLAILLKDLMTIYLPEDAHKRLRNRLYISVTILQGLRCGLITDFHSKDHLIECLIASSFVPGFMGWIPPGLEGDDLLDMADIVSPLEDLLCDSDSESESTEVDSDGDGDCRPVKSTKRRSAAEAYSRRCSLDTDSVWGVCTYDYKSDGCSKAEGGSKDKGKVKKSDEESYLTRLVRLCFSGIQTTTRVVRNVPGASLLMDRLAPGGFNNMDSLMEAIFLEMLSNRYMVLDGGFSDNIPTFDNNTITVAPFSGESDICPRDLTAIDFNIDLGRTSMHASEDNIFRLSHALKPMDPEMLLKLCEEGYNECLKFLHSKDLLSCRKHLMTRATLATSPCNIGHAHCRCQLCRAADAKIRTSLSCVNCHRAKRKALQSVLPKDVREEFAKAIKDYKEQEHTTPITTYWSRLIAALWWCAEKMYASTIKGADLAIRFQLWLMRFWDNIACFAKFSILPLGQKRRLVRQVLSSLKTCIGAATHSAGNQAACGMRNLHSMCT